MEPEEERMEMGYLDLESDELLAIEPEVVEPDSEAVDEPEAIDEPEVIDVCSDSD